MKYRSVVLASGPLVEATPASFRLHQAQTPPRAEGQYLYLYLVRHRWLSLEPCMRVRMNDVKGCAPLGLLEGRHFGKQRVRLA